MEISGKDKRKTEAVKALVQMSPGQLRVLKEVRTRFKELTVDQKGLSGNMSIALSRSEIVDMEKKLERAGLPRAILGRSAQAMGFKLGME